jgi:hypothetical protein
VAGFARRRCPGGNRVVDENETVKNFVAFELVIVLEPHDTGRVEVKFGQPALREREEHQDEEQDCERYLLATGQRIHSGPINMQLLCQGIGPFPFNALGIPEFPNGDARGQEADNYGHRVPRH